MGREEGLCVGSESVAATLRAGRPPARRALCAQRAGPGSRAAVSLAAVAGDRVPPPARGAPAPAGPRSPAPLSHSRRRPAPPFAPPPPPLVEPPRLRCRCPGGACADGRGKVARRGGARGARMPGVRQPPAAAALASTRPLEAPMATLDPNRGRRRHRRRPHGAAARTTVRRVRPPAPIPSPPSPASTPVAACPVSTTGPSPRRACPWRSRRAGTRTACARCPLTCCR